MSESEGFNKLHRDVQRWIWAQNWSSLRDIQEQAIEPVLNANSDVIISAATAAGKTEAAFLPACSYLAELPQDGVGILYISPLKALINDQYRRLTSLCEILDLPLTPWHGDVLQSVKSKLRKKPGGILLITPESLESLLLNQMGWCSQSFSGLSHIIIDEFHAFIGTERGCQLQSLMHRLEFLLQRTIPRIALSATLGGAQNDKQKTGEYLRPGEKYPLKLIESSTTHSDLKIQLRGYLNSIPCGENEPAGFRAIAEDLYKILRGKSHLVFANSRGRTEELVASLSDKCKRDCVPNEFFTHHGSLSKEIREGLESRLHEDQLPTTAVCTMTLELGIDIGHVDSIAQVTSPHSVASLRQRLGRSGRRGDAAVLRMFILEEEVTAKSHLLDRLRLETFQCIAMISLLLKKRYEPAPENQYHFSTLVQQTLSTIGQYGGVRANQLWSLLCNIGPFSLVDNALYAKFLRALGEQELITQTQDGQLVLGFKGENLVEHYTFYTAFSTPEEYRLECDGRVLGTLPIDKPLAAGQLIIFAGRRWEVIHIDSEKKQITLKRAKGGRPPKFGGEGQTVHDIVREEMFNIYKEGVEPIYLNDQARSIFTEGVECFHSLGLDNLQVIEVGTTVNVLPWVGDKIVNTITVLLREQGLSADCFAGVIDIRNASIQTFYDAVSNILVARKPTSTQLAHNVPDTRIEKHDLFLPKELRDIGYGARFFDIDGAWEWLGNINR